MLARVFSRCVITAVLAVFATVSARSEDRRGTVSIKSGVVFSNMAKAASNADASASWLGTPLLVSGLAFRVFGFRPEADYTIFGRTDKADTYTSKLLALSLPYVFSEGSFELRGGPTAWIQSFHGKGGNIDLQNGTTTATFSKPGRDVSTRVLGLVVGTSIPFSSNVDLDLDLHALAPLSSRRSFNVMAQLAWSFL